jgi:hypothetical protein
MVTGAIRQGLLIFGSDSHFKWLVQCWYLQYLRSQAVKTSVNSDLVSPPIRSLLPSLIPNSCYPLDKLEGKLETGVGFKLGANWLFWNLDTGGYHSLFGFWIGDCSHNTEMQGGTWNRCISEFHPRYFFLCTEFRTVSCVLPKHQVLTH